MGYEVEKTEEQWREELGDERYRVLRQAGTERAWTGELLDEARTGLYTCAACGAELFKSGTKFDSGCGWPSFYDSVRPEAVEGPVGDRGGDRDRQGMVVHDASLRASVRWRARSAVSQRAPSM